MFPVTTGLKILTCRGRMGKRRKGLVTVNCKVVHAVARMSMFLNPSIAREASFTTRLVRLVASLEKGAAPASTGCAGRQLISDKKPRVCSTSNNLLNLRSGS